MTEKAPTRRSGGRVTGDCDHNAIARDLIRLLDVASVLTGTTRAYLNDATESRNLRGRADAIALPRTPEEVADVVGWCYSRDVPIVLRGGGSGYAGGAVPR